MGLRLATRHGVHQTLIGDWKRQALNGLVTVFSGHLSLSVVRECERVSIRCSSFHYQPAGETVPNSEHRI